MVGTSEPGTDEDHGYFERIGLQLQGCQVRSALLAQQLTVALDSLDRAKESHRRELNWELKERKILEGRLRRLREITEGTERERDDLRDSVLELVQKVESSHGGFTKWPSGGIKLSGAVDPPQHMPSGSRSSNDQQLSYAGGIIRSLHRALRVECEAHSATRQKVIALEAQIARRDAELEHYIQHRPKSPSPPGIRGADILDRAMDTDQISLALQQTLANNKVLEVEVWNLEQKLERARQEATSEPEKSGGSHLSTSPSEKAEPCAHGPHEHTAFRISDRIKPPSSALFNPDHLSYTPTGRVRSSPPAAFDLPPDGLLSHSILHDFEQQVSALAAEVQAFKEERDMIFNLLQTDPRHNSAFPPGFREPPIPGDDPLLAEVSEVATLLQTPPSSTLQREQRSHLITQFPLNPVLHFAEQINALALHIDALRDEREVFSRIVRSDLLSTSAENGRRIDRSTSAGLTNDLLTPCRLPEPVPLGDAPLPYCGKQTSLQRNYVDANVQTDQWPSPTRSSHSPPPHPMQPPRPDTNNNNSAPSDADLPVTSSSPNLIELDVTPSSHAPCNITPRSESVQETLTDGEISMELATPLLPLTELCPDLGSDSTTTVVLSGEPNLESMEGDDEGELQEPARMIRPRVS